MLKKLVKYGNSSALVLDKAILELLNIREGSLVKIKTDGVSLIITPHEPVQAEQVSPTVTAEDVTAEGAVESLRKMNPKFANAHNAKELKDIMAETKAKMIKVNDELAILESNKEYKKELEKLKKKHKEDPSSLMLAVAALQHKYAPHMRKLMQELDSSPLMGNESLQQTEPVVDKKEAGLLSKAYMAINEKYRSARDAFDKLQDNEEFQHEMALLAQQQTKPVDLKAYTAANYELLCKYIPEWRAYQEEMLKAAQEYQERTGIEKTKK